MFLKIINAASMIMRDKEIINAASARDKEIAEITPIGVTHGKTLNNNEAGYAAAHVIDGDLHTKSVTTIDNGVAWLKIEFDKTYFINKVVIYYMFVTDWYDTNSWCPKSVSNFKSCVNQDNNVDVSVYQGEVKKKSCGTLQLTDGLEQSDQIYTLLCNTEGDTVKLSKSSGYIQVCEVVVTSDGKCL